MNDNFVVEFDVTEDTRMIPMKILQELMLDIDYRLMNAQDIYSLNGVEDAGEWDRIQETRRKMGKLFGPLAMYEHKEV